MNIFQKIIEKFLNLKDKSKIKRTDLKDSTGIFFEIEEIAEKLLEKIDKRVEELKESEKIIDNKILELKRLLLRVDMNKISKNAYDKKNDIIKLYLEGENPDRISKVLNIPIGEVELIINLFQIKTSKK